MGGANNRTEQGQTARREWRRNNEGKIKRREREREEARTWTNNE
jgi:hypothetical protein